MAIPLHIQQKIDRKQRLIELKAAKIARLRAESERAADNAPGSYVTGSSGRTRQMNEKTDRALNKTIDNAVEIYKLNCQIGRLRTEIYYLQNQEEIKTTATVTKQRAKTLERMVKAAEASLPLINDPAAGYHMTSVEWGRMHRDYKGVVVHPSLPYRYRSAIRDSRLVQVYLTDKPEILPPGGANGC